MMEKNTDLDRAVTEEKEKFNISEEFFNLKLKLIEEKGR